MANGMFDVGEILLEMERAAVHHDGLVTIPAHLFEALHNEVFSEDQQHDYTEAT